MLCHHLLQDGWTITCQCDLDNQSLTLHEIWIWFLECLFVHTPENPCFDVWPCKIPIFPWFITGVSIAHSLEPFLIPNHVHDHQHANDWLVRDFKIIYSIFHWMSWWLLVFPPEQEVRILYHQNTDNLYHKNAATWAWWAWITLVYLRVGKDNRSSRMQSCLEFAQWLGTWKRQHWWTSFDFVYKESSQLWCWNQCHLIHTGKPFQSR